jgi:nucleoside-diphosphate-sugar epimerase
MSDNGLTGARVLVTGAGCLGARVIPRLQQDSVAEIRVLDRSPGRLLDLGEGVVAIQGDITDSDVVAEAVEGVDYVIHTAAMLEGDVDMQRIVNVDGTRTIAEASAKAGVKRFVHISSNAVYGFCEGVITEEYGPHPTGQVYSMSKAEAEQVVRSVGEEHGLDYAIVRPAAIFGPGAEYFTKTFMKRALKRPIVMVGRGHGDQAVVYVDDVADLAVVAAAHPNASGEAFNCAIDPPPTMREYLHTYGRVVGNETWLGIPMWIVRLAGYPIALFSKKYTYGRQMPQNMRQVDRYVVFSVAKAKERLGWEPAYTVESGVAASLPWLRDEGVLDGVAVATPEEA